MLSLYSVAIQTFLLILLLTVVVNPQIRDKRFNYLTRQGYIVSESSKFSGKC
jgi:hypothetical protein